MITCVSERSGIASSGVVLTAHTPATASIAAASSTRKRLATDHRMTAAIICFPPPGGAEMRASAPLRLASESTRNCPEMTMRCPARRPLRISVMSPDSRPTSTAAGTKRPSPASTITTLRLPVLITASLGTSTTCLLDAPPNFTVANIPGFSDPPGFASTMRARTVRVCALTSGSSAFTEPLKTRSGYAAARASTGAPLRTNAACASGTSAVTHTLPMPASLKSVVPGMTAIPSRAPISQTMPPCGAVTVTRADGLRSRSMRAISVGGMPSRRKRCRADSARSAAPGCALALSASSSSCAASHSGTYSSASGCPAATPSYCARTRRRST